jgi:hypothetical protein
MPPFSRLLFRPMNVPKLLLLVGLFCAGLSLASPAQTITTTRRMPMDVDYSDGAFPHSSAIQARTASQGTTTAVDPQTLSITSVDPQYLYLDNTQAVAVQVNGSGFEGGYEALDCLGPFTLPPGIDPNQFYLAMGFDTPDWNPGWCDFLFTSPPSNTVSMAFVGNQNDLAVAPSGELFNLESGRGIIHKFKSDMTPDGGCNAGTNTMAMALDPKTDYITMTSYNTGLIGAFDENGNLVSGANGNYNPPQGVAIAADNGMACVVQATYVTLDCDPDITVVEGTVVSAATDSDPHNVAMATAAGNQEMAYVYARGTSTLRAYNVPQMTSVNVTPNLNLPTGASNGFQLALLGTSIAAILDETNGTVVLVDVVHMVELHRATIQGGRSFRLAAFPGRNGFVVAVADANARLTRYAFVDAQSGNVTQLPETSTLLSVGFGPGVSCMRNQCEAVTNSMTTVATTPNPSTFGQQVTITATVGPPGPPMPTGTVNFSSNGAAISGCTAVPLSSGNATCVTSALAVGADATTATYSGDSNYDPSIGLTYQIVNPLPVPLQFVNVTPCRVVDTRGGGQGGITIQGGTAERFFISGGGPFRCNIPESAIAYSLNVTVVPYGPLGYLTIWPTGEGRPIVSTMNSSDGRIKANAAIVPAGDQGAVSIYATDTTDVILDINGYFEPVSGSTLAFYPLPPCRVADTRHDTYPPGLGPPSLVGGQPRAFPVLNNTCIPTGVNPAAYSFNFTVVPGGHSVGYLSVWPTGQTQPVVSTLNDQTGTIVANAAIVPAGTGGDISVYSTDNTQLVIDIDGYFAPAGQGGLSLYPVAPCRVIDTRHVGSGQPFSGTLSPPVDVVDSPCGPPATAQAYVFNATVVPSGSLGYLTLWPDGTDQPVVSTLNAFDGALTNNMAIVPTNNGKVDAYAGSGLTQLILDISSYFAP